MSTALFFLYSDEAEAVDPDGSSKRCSFTIDRDVRGFLGGLIFYDFEPGAEVALLSIDGRAVWTEPEAVAADGCVQGARVAVQLGARVSLIVRRRFNRLAFLVDKCPPAPAPLREQVKS